MLKGSCLCGTIKYEVAAELGEIAHCHCIQCQKAHGAAFGSYAQVDKQSFKFTEGSENISCYRSSKNVTRTFCGICGSTLQFIDGQTPQLNFALATLDDPIQDRATVEIWCSERASWWNHGMKIDSRDFN